MWARLTRLRSRHQETRSRRDPDVSQQVRGETESFELLAEERRSRVRGENEACVLKYSISMGMCVRNDQPIIKVESEKQTIK